MFIKLTKSLFEYNFYAAMFITICPEHRYAFMTEATLYTYRCC